MSVSQLVVLACSAGMLAGLAAAAGGPAKALLAADFEKDPRKAGWVGAADRGEFQGAWARADDDSRGRFLRVEKGHWQSPAAAVEPFAYYRLRFRSKAVADGYWAAFFANADGNQLQADHYDSLPGSRAWAEREYCFRANVDAASVQVRFQARRYPLAVDDVHIERIDRPAAAAWADKVYAALPPVSYAPPAGRGKLLPGTMARLRTGPALRVVMLGDSIANDTSHSCLDVLLERAQPKCRVEWVNSVRGGTGCAWYRQEDRIARYVLPYRPDLLIIAGISSGYGWEDIREVIRQVRAASGCEIMVLTGCVHPRVQGEINFVENTEMPRDEACEVVLRFPQRLAAMCRGENVELMDIRKAWDEYIAASPMPHAWYLRDPIHANTRGKQILGRILLRYLGPGKEKG